MNLSRAILIIVPIALQAWLGVVLFGRRLHKRFPCFFAYTLFSVGSGAAKALVNGNRWPYFLVYWISEGLYAILGFLSIYEAFRTVFRSFYVLHWFKYLLPGVAGLALSLALLKGLLFPPQQAPPLLAAILVSELAVRFIQGFVFALFVMLAWLRSVSVRSYAFGIAFGFSVVSFGILITVLLRSEFGLSVARSVNLAPAVAYLVAEAIWLWFFLNPEPQEPLIVTASPLTALEIVDLLEQYTAQVKAWAKQHLPLQLDRE
jgi:hypothetical protein